jgi:hypothetical protein
MVPRYDTSGFILEHYVDGDQVNCHNETKISQASLDDLHVWGKSWIPMSEGDRMLIQ